MSLPRALLMLMRIEVAIQVILGIGFWTGHWYAATPVHQTIGTTYVLLLWILALYALITRRTWGLSIFALLWGLGLAMLGFSQRGILAGSNLHWIVRVVHLLVGVTAIPIAERLAGPRRATAPPERAMA